MTREEAVREYLQSEPMRALFNAGGSVCGGRVALRVKINGSTVRAVLRRMEAAGELTSIVQHDPENGVQRRLYRPTHAPK